MPDRRGSIYAGIERGNVRLRDSEVEQYETIIQYVRDHPGCRRTDIEQNTNIHSASTLVAIAILSGRIRGDGCKPEHLEAVE